MFTYIKLKNYKSFDDITIDLTDKNGNPKKLIIIYGENAAGKTNIASTFYFLGQLLRSMNIRDVIQKFLLNGNNSDNNLINLLKEQRYIHDVELLIKDSKTIDSSDPMYIEYGFNINNKKGCYIIETNNNQIIHEKLEYTLIKNKGIYFDLTPNSCKISKQISKSQAVYDEIKSGYDKFWGKHCMLSIINHEIIDKSENYIENQLNDNFKILLEALLDISVKGKITHGHETGGLSYESKLATDLSNGFIKDKETNQLKAIEKSLKEFFPLINPDIVDVNYILEKNNNSISYSLYFTKYISGEIKRIPYYLESNGIQQILEIIPFLYNSTRGLVTVIDEFDLGIHPRLNQILISDLIPEINGQLILTAHDVSLLDTMKSGISNDSIYMIYRTDKFGNREIKCLTKIDSNLNSKSNISKQYLSGKFNDPDNNYYFTNEAKINYKEIFNTFKQLK